jgi:tetratricopeptide (TPR) repeat protein
MRAIDHAIEIQKALRAMSVSERIMSATRLVGLGKPEQADHAYREAEKIIAGSSFPDTEPANRERLRQWLRLGAAWIPLQTEMLARPEEAARIRDRIWQEMLPVAGGALRRDLLTGPLAEDAALWWQANVHLEWRLGQYSAAEKIARRLVYFWKSRGCLKRLVPSRFLLGSLLREQGFLRRAHRQFETALGEARTIPDAVQEAIALGHLGELLDEQGDHEAATEYLKDRLGIAEKLQDPLLKIGALESLALNYSAAGRHGQARETLAQSLEIASGFATELIAPLRAIDGPLVFERWLDQGGEALRREAESALTHAVEILETRGLLGMAGPAYVMLALALMAKNDADAARQVLERGRRRIPESAEMSQRWLDLADRIVNRNDLSACLGWFDRQGPRVRRWIEKVRAQGGF